MANYYDDITARLYQSGVEVDEAVQKGANRQKFEDLETEFKGGSIPAHLIYGFAYKKPYSCEYHSGGKMGEKLRDICAELKG